MEEHLSPQQESHILHEKIKVLFGNQVIALAVNIFVAALFVVKIFATVTTFHLVIWLSLLAVSLLPRAFVGRVFQKNYAESETIDAKKWLAIYIGLMAVSGLVWGVGGVYFAAMSGVESYSFTAFVLGGLVVGSISVAGIIFSTYVVYLITALLPIVLFFLFDGSLEVELMGILLLAYIVIMTFMAKKYGAAFHNSLLLQVQKEDIIVSLESTQKELQKSEQRFKDVAMSSADFIWEIGPDFNYSYVSGKVTDMLGYTAEELMGTSPFEYVSPQDVEMKKQEFATMYGKKIPLEDFETWHIAKDGSLVCVLTNGVPILDDDGEILGYRGVNKDITSRKELYERLEHLATHDTLTGLYNRRVLEEQLEIELSRCKRYDRELAIVMLDIDHFKKVNDTYGHGDGDIVLQKIAEIMQDVSRKVDIVTRVGGEEFIILLPETPLKGAQLFSERLRSSVETCEFISSAGEVIPVTISLGIASAPVHGDAIDLLLLAVDKALYKAKEGGRNRVCAATLAEE